MSDYVSGNEKVKSMPITFGHTRKKGTTVAMCLAKILLLQISLKPEVLLVNEI